MRRQSKLPRFVDRYQCKRKQQLQLVKYEHLCTPTFMSPM